MQSPQNLFPKPEILVHGSHESRPSPRGLPPLLAGGTRAACPEGKAARLTRQLASAAARALARTATSGSTSSTAAAQRNTEKKYQPFHSPDFIKYILPTFQREMYKRGSESW